MVSCRTSALLRFGSSIFTVFAAKKITKPFFPACAPVSYTKCPYLLEADPELPLRIKEDENSEIGWIGVEEIERRSTEKWFVERIYSKLCKKAGSLGEKAAV